MEDNIRKTRVKFSSKFCENRIFTKKNVTHIKMNDRTSYICLY